MRYMDKSVLFLPLKLLCCVYAQHIFLILSYVLCCVFQKTKQNCRLQGFPDALFEKARAVNSDAQLYKQAGNAVTVNVAYVVAKSVADCEDEIKCIMNKK